MTDYSKLKAAALAATPGPWVAEQNNLFWYENGYTKHLMETEDGSDICHDEEHPANLAFIAAANPAAVLELIAENASLQTSLAEMTTFRDNAANHMKRIRAEATTFQKERDQLKAENEALREVMSCVVNEVPRYTHRDGNAPGHCHEVPGIWDRGNGGKAGTVCGWCKVWNAAVAMSKEPQS